MLSWKNDLETSLNSRSFHNGRDIGLDHQEWLGSDVETIAIEKCGIARSGKPCIVADEAESATYVCGTLG